MMKLSSQIFLVLNEFECRPALSGDGDYDNIAYSGDDDYDNKSCSEDDYHDNKSCSEIDYHEKNLQSQYDNFSDHGYNSLPKRYQKSDGLQDQLCWVGARRHES